jgi:uncharacterized protein YlxW (UPF0749 family)
MDPAIVVAGLSGVVALACAVLTFRSSGRATNVNEQAEQLQWVKDMREGASEARKEVKELQEEVRTLKRQLDVVTREADHWIAEYQLVHRTAWRPGMTLDRVRELLGPEAPTPNGRQVT